MITMPWYILSLPQFSNRTCSLRKYTFLKMCTMQEWGLLVTKSWIYRSPFSKRIHKRTHIFFIYSLFFIYSVEVKDQDWNLCMWHLKRLSREAHRGTSLKSQVLLWWETCCQWNDVLEVICAPSSIRRANSWA